MAVFQWSWSPEFAWHPGKRLAGIHQRLFQLLTDSLF
jgi:hypothetical protein